MARLGDGAVVIGRITITIMPVLIVTMPIPADQPLGGLITVAEEALPDRCRQEEGLLHVSLLQQAELLQGVQEIPPLLRDALQRVV